MARMPRLVVPGYPHHVSQRGHLWQERFHSFLMDEDYLSSNSQQDTAESIRRHNRTGRPLGSAEFIQTLEQQTGKTLAPGRPGPKPSPTG